MSIQGEYPIDDFVSGRWADDEPAIRLQAVHSLGKSGPQSQPLLARLAMEDDDAEVRAAAVSYLNEPDLLHPLREQPSPIQEAAILQYHKILA
ncbi:MAG: HEAT repeat domain-containing protein, partial [Pseudohongiellaceae bacterium]